MSLERCYINDLFFHQVMSLNNKKGYQIANPILPPPLKEEEIL